MARIIISKSAMKALCGMGTKEAERVLGVLERIRVRPIRYLRPLVTDPAHRLMMDDTQIYIDISGEDLMVLAIR